MQPFNASIMEFRKNNPTIDEPIITILRKTELIRQKFIKWSLELGVHGYPNIFRAQSWLLKAIWIVSPLAAVGACCYLIQLSITEYLEYNVNTRIRTFVQLPMQLPGIDIFQVKIDL